MQALGQKTLQMSARCLMLHVSLLRHAPLTSILAHHISSSTSH